MCASLAGKHSSRVRSFVNSWLARRHLSLPPRPSWFVGSCRTRLRTSRRSSALCGCLGSAAFSFATPSSLPTRRCASRSTKASWTDLPTRSPPGLQTGSADCRRGPRTPVQQSAVVPQVVQRASFPDAPNHRSVRARASLFPCFATLAFPFRPEVVSNACLKISQSFEIGGDRANQVFSVQIRCQICRGRGGGDRERGLRLYLRPDRKAATSFRPGRADSAGERRAGADDPKRSPAPWRTRADGNRKQAGKRGGHAGSRLGAEACATGAGRPAAPQSKVRAGAARGSEGARGRAAGDLAIPRRIQFCAQDGGAKRPSASRVWWSCGIE